VDDNGFLIWLAVFVGTIVAMVYLVTPLVLWARRSFPARPPLRRFELSGVDRPTAEYLARHATDLLTLGFDEPAHFRMSELNDTTTSYFILAVDLDAGTVGSVAVTLYGPKKARRFARVAFSNRTDDGGQVATSNLAVPVLFIRPETVALQVPSVESAAELLALHRAAVARHPLDGRPVLYESGREAEYLDQYYFRQTYDEGVRRGTFRYRESADEYRLTLPGAFAMVWANLPPLKWLHARRLRSEDRRVLAEYGEAR
jgi:hypothetical protein